MGEYKAVVAQRFLFLSWTFPDELNNCLTKLRIVKFKFYSLFKAYV